MHDDNNVHSSSRNIEAVTELLLRSRASGEQIIARLERRCATRSNRSFNRLIFIGSAKIACGEYF